MRKVIIIICGIFILLGKAFSQTYPNNEDGIIEDMLTPAYYQAANGDPFRNEINGFVHFAQLESFRHPLENAMGQKPDYTTPTIGEFGAVKGMAPNQEYHPGIDMHVANNKTNVVMYAAYDGTVKTYRDGLFYRDYLTLTKNIAHIWARKLLVVFHIYRLVDTLIALHRTKHGRRIQNQ